MEELPAGFTDWDHKDMVFYAAVKLAAGMYANPVTMHSDHLEDDAIATAKRIVKKIYG